MSCFTPKGFRLGIYKLISPILKSNNQETIKKEILDAIANISRSMSIEGKDVDEAINILNTHTLKNLKGLLSDEEMRGALMRYNNERTAPKQDLEDTSSNRLANNNLKAPEEDVFETAYGTAIYPKIQGKQHLNKVGINSILYDTSGIFDGSKDINSAIERQQEQLLLNILNYLKSTGVDTSSFPLKMYIDGKYTGALDYILMEVTKEQLDKWYNDKDKEALLAYSSYVILSNFDNCLKKLFGKAISIDPDASLYQLGKYSIAGGSNVFATWRTNEEIDLSKEVNNITQAIVTSIPFISKYGDRNVKFNEFCYIISKIKDLVTSATGDYIINIKGDSEFKIKDRNTKTVSFVFSDDTIELADGQSFISLITKMRSNPQRYLPVIMELLNNQKFISKLTGKVFDKGFLLQIDRDLINSIYKGLFDRTNPESLIHIQELGKGYNGTNYFAFVALTIDSIYKAGFLQYFIDPEGKIYVRNMYDLSISNIQYTIKDTINGINSKLRVGNYDKIREKYHIEVIQSLVDGNTEIPREVELTVKDLKIRYNLVDGKISYYRNGEEVSISTSAEYKKYSRFIDDVLKQNLDLDILYLDAFKALKGTNSYVLSLLDTSVRVVVNQFLSNTELKDLNRINTISKLNKLFPNEGALYKPKYNNRLKEIGFITDADIDTLNCLALAKALVTGRLTSSQILDGDGNALSSSTLSRLVSTHPYLIQQQIKESPIAAAKDFSIWKSGVFKGIFLLKEIKNNLAGESKSHTKFSAEEMETSTVFIDFLQGILSKKKASTSPLGNGLVCFYPSENSDKTYVGRMIIDLNKLKVVIDGREKTWYEAIKENGLVEAKLAFLPVIQEEFRQFYNKALENINQEWKKLGDYIGLQISYNDWSSVNIQAALEHKIPLQWINEKVTEYNNANPFNPITLIDQVHYVADKGGILHPNESLLENIRRFNNTDVFRDFLYKLLINVLQSLLKDGVEVPSNPDIEQIIGKDWIDTDTNTVILAKVYDELTGEVRNIRKNKDFNVNELELEHNNTIVLNPLIDTYNTLNFFFTQEFMNSTVGAYYGHPSKHEYNINLSESENAIKDEESRKAALDKRNVSFTAAMHSYLHDLLQGVPDVINMAVMPDVEDKLLTISGDTFNTKNFDGATFENPFFGRMINKSLGGARVGKNKKTFIHFYNEKTGTGGIVKTADYCISNYEIRESKFYQVMMQNMTDRAWRNEDGSLITDLNVLVDYNGNPINYGNPNGGLAGQLYFKGLDGKNYAILEIKYLGNNQYSRTLQEVNSEGRAIGELFVESEIKTVDTNYKLWKLFGGERALELRVGTYSGKLKLEWSEHSLDIVADIMNKVGYPKSESVRYLSDIWQPLKHSDIHIMPTIGALKQGAANVNDLSAYTTADSDKINFMRIRLDLAGIQLDKEHNANGEELSIMTQVISACAARGYTQEKCQEMYEALAALARAGIKEHSDAFEEFFKINVDPNLEGEQKDAAVQAARDKYQKTILDILINALKNSTNDSITLLIVTKEILQKAREGKELLLVDICYSDPAMFNKLHSTLSVALTRAAVKIKVDGILSVLCPTFNVRKIYGGKTLSSYGSDAEIVAELNKLDKEGKTLIWEFNQFGTIDKLSNIRPGRHYLVTKADGSRELRYIRTHTEYYAFRNEVLNNGEIINVKELFAPIPELGFEGGRELASYHATFRNRVNAVDPQLQSLPTGSEIRAELEGIKDWNKKLQRALELLGEHIDISEIYNEGNIYYHLAGIPKITPESFRKETGYSTKDLQRIISMLASHYPEQQAIDLAISNYDSLLREALSLTEEPKSFNIYDLQSVKELADLKELIKYQKDNGLEITVTKAELDEALANVLRDLNILGNIKTANPEETNVVKLIDETEIEVDPNSVEIDPYEIIMPKIFAEIFGLDEYDDLESIKQDPDFFTKKLIDRIQVAKCMPKESFTVGLMRINGKHVYLLNSEDAKQTDTFRKKRILLDRIHGKLYRILNGERVYLMNDGDEVWEQTLENGTTVEVIVTKNLQSYINKLNYNTLFISENVYMNPPKRNNILSNIRRSKNKTAKHFIWALNHTDTGGIEQDIENIQFVHIDNLDDSAIGDYFRKLGSEMHTSFLKSLKVVAARIPALSMQSFMPMKVVAFEAPDINTAYVGTAQFLFLGSDLDIDAVSLASFAFGRNGKYLIHSPHANVSSSALLEASENLPFPTGKILPVKRTEKPFNWGKYVAQEKTIGKPFYVENGELQINNDDVEAINKLSELIRLCNKQGFIPGTGLNSEAAKRLHQLCVDLINEHNDYINVSNNVEEFAKNYVVSAMYDIGVNPANLIESLLAMDYITKPLKDVSNNTEKALSESSSGHVANFTTNIRGFILNMAGKEGVGICAVGLKSFFGLTARYNEILNNGTPWEIERLKSEMTIAKRKFKMLANVYSKSEISAGILKDLLDLRHEDLALVLSALLSLATDNAKELALDKLNASNMLGMYIFGIVIGCDFQTLADVIASPVGIVINDLIKSNSFSDKKGMNIPKILDYLEVGPKLVISHPIYDPTISTILQQDLLRKLAWFDPRPLEEKINALETNKKRIKGLDERFVQGTIEFNRAIEKAQEYLEQVAIIKENREIYEDFKNLFDGAEELRLLGKYLHVNQGLETSYAKAMSYISTITTAISTRSYSEYRKRRRKAQHRDEKVPKQERINAFNFHMFVSDKSYREACIDLYEGRADIEKLSQDATYRKAIVGILNYLGNPTPENIERAVLNSNVHKVFFNILDTLLVPHYMSYLESSDLLHQMMMSSSVKYRTIYNLGRKAVSILGVYSTEDIEKVFKRTELFVDRLMRDRFLMSRLKIEIPEGVDYFIKEGGKILRLTSTSGTQIQLGTKEGNASFKLLMEEVIIPELIELTKDRNSLLYDNNFIKSLAITVYKNTPLYTTITGYAPNINMSPRSDNEKALFEQIKFDFNKLRRLGYTYDLCGKALNLIELFWIYNLITFGGRPGENTLTSIFQDVQDFGIIKAYRQYISQLDKSGNFELTVSAQTLAKEVALRDNPYTSTMNAFYYEDVITGDLSWFEKESPYNDYEDVGLDDVRTVNGFIGTSPFYATKQDLKNYFVSDQDTDIYPSPIRVENNYGSYSAYIEKGRLVSITVLTPAGEEELKLSDILKLKLLKLSLPTKSLYTPEGFRSIYDVKSIELIVNNVIRELKCNI